MTIKREDLIAEELIRTYVRKRITEKLKHQQLAEQAIRKVIRKMILAEAETGTDEASRSTGINVLADLLEKIIPTLQDDYSMLTSSEEQRESFKNHIVHAIENSLKPIEAVEAAEQEIAATANETIEYEIDADVLTEKISVDLDPEDDSVDALEGEFIDIDGDGEPDDDFVQLDDQNETGRNFAAATYKKIEKQVVDAYDMLADQDDQNIFYDYLVTNLLLYFDKFEDELQNALPGVSTPEYEEEKEKAAGSTDDPFGDDFSDEEVDL